MGNTEFSFELPDVGEQASVSRPRIHIAGDVCVSCEG
jgi:hypothetical protein